MITVLTGANSYTVSEMLAELKRTFVSKYGEAGLEQLSVEKIVPGQLKVLLTSVSLFASQRMVVARGISDNKVLSEELGDLLMHVPAEVHLVLIEPAFDKRTAYYKALKKQPNFYEFSQLNETELPVWIKSEVKRQNATIDSTSLRLLVEYVGPDQLRLKNEISKLANYDTHITKATIEQLVEKRPQDTIFQLLELTLSGQTGKAMQVLENLERAHEDPFQIANMLIWQTHILAVVASAGVTSDNDVAKAAKLSPFVVKKTRHLAGRNSNQKLNATLDTVAQLDVLLKTSASPPWRVIEQAILAI